MFITSAVVAILVPALSRARSHGRKVISANNQRQIAVGVNCYSHDNEEKYPETVATIGSGRDWNYQEPFVLTCIWSRTPNFHRSTSEYLASYINTADVMHCANAPKKYKHLSDVWADGDNWDNPDTWYPFDWAKGTFCFYWNYVGVLDTGELFVGPRSVFDKRLGTKILASCYLGYDCYRSPGAYSSCERFAQASITQENVAASAYWSRPGCEGFSTETMGIRPNALYADGHVESFPPSEMVPMRVIKNRFNNAPYQYGPGIFYIPKTGIE